MFDTDDVLMKGSGISRPRHVSKSTVIIRFGGEETEVQDTVIMDV